MDAAELIVSALAESAAACRAGQARAQVMRARLQLISLLRERLPGERRVLVGLAEADPRAECARLADSLRQSSADADRVVIAAARRLLGLLHPAPPPGTPNDPPGAPSEGGLGEGPTRPRASSASPGGRVRTGRPPGSQPGGGLTGGSRDGRAMPSTHGTPSGEPRTGGDRIRDPRGSRPMTTRGRPGSRADGDPITRPSVGPTAPGTRSTALGQRESGGGRVGGEQPGQPGDVDRVIVISGCSGIQVGEGNDPGRARQTADRSPSGNRSPRPRSGLPRPRAGAPGRSPTSCRGLPRPPGKALPNHRSGLCRPVPRPPRQYCRAPATRDPPPRHASPLEPLAQPPTAQLNPMLAQSVRQISHEIDTIRLSALAHQGQFVA